MELDMGKRIILKVITNNPEVLKIDTDKIERLFAQECYNKLERIRDLLHDINLEERACLKEIYEVLFEWN